MSIYQLENFSNKDQKLILEKWGLGLIYYGSVNLFDLIINSIDIFEKDIQSEINKTIKGQYIYLGYDKSYDVFIISFDLFYKDLKSSVIMFKIDEKNDIKIVSNHCWEEFFYHDVYKEIKKVYPNLVDITLS